MFSLFKKNPNKAGKKITLAIEGMHCTSCGLNIDSQLEEIDGVLESKTSYAQSKTIVTLKANKVSEQMLIDAIKACGYSAKIA